jgi:hypothetical protein
MVVVAGEEDEIFTGSCWHYDVSHNRMHLHKATAKVVYCLLAQVNPVTCISTQSTTTKPRESTQK